MEPNKESQAFFDLLNEILAKAKDESDLCLLARHYARLKHSDNLEERYALSNAIYQKGLAELAEKRKRKR